MITLVYKIGGKIKTAKFKNERELNKHINWLLLNNLGEVLEVMR